MAKRTPGGKTTIIGAGQTRQEAIADVKGKANGRKCEVKQCRHNGQMYIAVAQVG